MYIVIDTNIFYRNWFLQSPLFTYLANFANNTRCTLVIPKVIVAEVENKYHTSFADLAAQLDKLQYELLEFGSDVPCKIEVPPRQFDFAAILKSKFDHIQIIDYSSVPHEILVEKAIRQRRPFRGKEKGYRDALIWLSLLSLLKEENNNRDVFFVSNNASDFLDEARDNKSLHPDLLVDIENSGIRNSFKPFLSLKDFVDQNVDKSVHYVNHQEFEEAYGNLLEEAASTAGIDHLNSLSPSIAKRYFLAARYPAKCLDPIIDFHFEDYEGVEDPEIVQITSVDQDRLFISYRFNFLSVCANCRLDTGDYYAAESEFNQNFLNEFSEDGTTVVETFPRVFIDTSIIFDKAKHEVEKVSVDRVSFKIRF